jgi:hypothetical protein
MTPPPPPPRRGPARPGAFPGPHQRVLTPGLVEFSLRRDPRCGKMRAYPSSVARRVAQARRPHNHTPPGGARPQQEGARWGTSDVPAKTVTIQRRTFPTTHPSGVNGPESTSPRQGSLPGAFSSADLPQSFPVSRIFSRFVRQPMQIPALLRMPLQVPVRPGTVVATSWEVWFISASGRGI